MNKNNNIPGYNPYFDDGSNDRYPSEYETMNTYVNASGFRDSYEATGMPNNIMYPEEVALQRESSTGSTKKLLDKEIARGDSMKKLTRGDSEKKLQTLNTAYSVTVKKPVTRYEKFQAWMINEGKKNNVTQIKHTYFAYGIFFLCIN
jgi:hypothetical protein